jgi:hypothetical protein
MSPPSFRHQRYLNMFTAEHEDRILELLQAGFFIILESFCPTEVCLSDCTHSLARDDSNLLCKRPSYSLDFKITSLWLLIVRYCQFKRGQHYLLESLLLKLISEYNFNKDLFRLQFWPMCTLDSRLQNSHCSATQNRNLGRFLSSVECQFATRNGGIPSSIICYFPTYNS